MLAVRTHVAALGLALGGLVATAPAQLIFDDFETDSSASYTLIDDSNAASGDGGADSTSEFAFDYVGAGFPLAPNSAPGDVGGLRLTANRTEEGPEGPTSTEEDHIVAFHNTLLGGAYRLDVDIYMEVILNQPGTTEHAHVGVAGDNTDFTSIFNPVLANGHFLAMTGEGGSASDYRHATPSVPAVPSGDPSYLNSDNTTNATADVYQALFPDTEVPGSPTNTWTTMTITVADNVTYWLDGVPIITTPTESADGYVSLGLGDLFDSVGPHSVIYDNLVVSSIPEPTTAMLALAGLAGLGMRRRV